MAVNANKPGSKKTTKLSDDPYGYFGSGGAPKPDQQSPFNFWGNQQPAAAPQAPTQPQGAQQPQIGDPFDFWGIPAQGDGLTPGERLLNRKQEPFPWMLAPIEHHGVGKVPDTTVRKGHGLSPRQGGPGERSLTLADYIKQAMELLGGGADYSGLEQQLRNTHAENDARLSAMYAQLRGSIDSDTPKIQATYDDAGNAINANSDQAAADTKAGYEQARADQAGVFDRLGIQDAASVLAASQGNQAVEEQGGAVAGINQNRAANENANTSNKAAALDYNTNIGNAAGLEGDLQRALNNQGLGDKLADLQFKQSEANGQQRRDSISLGQQLQQYAQQQKAAGAPANNADNQQAIAEFLAQQQQQAYTNSTDQQAAGRDLMLALLKQFGGDSAKANEAYAQYQAAGLI